MFFLLSKRILFLRHKNFMRLNPFGTTCNLLDNVQETSDRSRCFNFCSHAHDETNTRLLVPTVHKFEGIKNCLS